jgi:hypothetical protein
MKITLQVSLYNDFPVRPERRNVSPKSKDELTALPFDFGPFQGPTLRANGGESVN